MRGKKEKAYDERKSLMAFNRFYSNYKIFTICYAIASVLLLLLITILINKFQNTDMSGVLTGDTAEVTNTVTIIDTIRYIGAKYLIGVLLIAIGYAKYAYGIRVSYGDLNVGQKGTAEWTDRRDLPKQYPQIPEKIESFPGMGGVPVSRQGDKLYCDTTNVNTLIIGGTRSGKGQAVIEPMAEILSRAEQKCSMVITDPKMELANKMVPELTRRGYETHVLNLVDPEYGMGFNPLALIIEEYKSGKPETAQQLTASLAYTVFQKNEQEKDPFFTDQARNVFIAAIMADITDNINLDKEDNARWKRIHDKEEKEREEQYYKDLYGAEYNTYLIAKYIENLNKVEPLTDQGLLYELEIARIRGDLPAIASITEEKIKEARTFTFRKSSFIRKAYYPSTENEDKINLYSIIAMCNYLSSIKTGTNRTALDDYFDKRDEDDFARITYGAIIQASEGTKGNIMSTFRGKLTIFSFDSIAKMTAKNTVNFMDLGFGKKPVAIFIALPDYDASNHFIATVFINQMYFVLAKMATAMPSGKLLRRVSFILDEFGNLPALDNFSNIITVCLGRNILFTLAIQSTAQLEQKYQEGAKTIKGNCGNWIYIMTQDEETAEEISKMLGNKTITTINRTGKKLSINKELTEMQDERPLMNADELMKLKMGETIVLRGMYREAKGTTKERIKALPIANLGENRMKFAYEYLSDVFPQNQLLYRSDKLDEIIKKNEHINIEELVIATGYIEDNKNIDMKKRTRSGKAYVDYLSYREEPFLPPHDERTGENLVKMNKAFRLLNLSEEEIKLCSAAGLTDPETGEVLLSEYVITNGKVIDYAHDLINMDDDRLKSIGYELLDLALPLKEKPVTKGEQEYNDRIEREIVSLN